MVQFPFDDGLEDSVEEVANLTAENITIVSNTVKRRYSLKNVWLAIFAHYIQSRTKNDFYPQVSDLTSPAYIAHGINREPDGAAELSKYVKRMQEYSGDVVLEWLSRKQFPIEAPHHRQPIVRQ